MIISLTGLVFVWSAPGGTGVVAPIAGVLSRRNGDYYISGMNEMWIFNGKIFRAWGRSALLVLVDMQALYCCDAI